MRAFLKNRPLALTTLGLLLLGSSAAWEYVRVRRDYRYIVSPWSLRGYETMQGKVIAATAAVLLVITLLLAFGRIGRTRFGSMIVAAGMVGWSVGIALVADTGDRTLSFLGMALIAMIGAGLVTNLAASSIGERARNSFKGAIRFGAWLAAFALLLFGVLNPIFGGKERPVWLIFLVLFGILAAQAILRHPSALAGWRLLMLATMSIWITAITMASALRVDLLQRQAETSGVAVEFGDAQITSGVLIAWVGGLLAFVGVVGLWAKRRDEIATSERAHRQQEAARESELQLASA